MRARLPGTYRVRLWAAGLTILFAALMLLAGEWMFAPGDVGQFLFHALGITAFLYCLLEGVRTTADSLSGEKRSGTLGLLFLTDLKGHDVVLGKLMATSLNSFYCLLAVFPPLAIPLVLGGITGGEFWRLVLMLTNTLLFSLAIGLFVSSISYHDRKAGAATLGLLAGLTLLPPLVPAFLGGGTILGLSPSPLAAYLSLTDAPYSSNPRDYWNAMLGVHLVCWGCVIMASVLLPRHWQVAPALDRRKRRAGEPFAFYSPIGERHLLDVHPILWLAHRHVRSSRPIWVLILGGGFVCLLLEYFFNNPTGLFVNALILHFIMAVWAASDACHALSGAKESGALELLLATPLRAEQIIVGYQQALQRKFLRPVAVLAFLEAVVLLMHAVIMGLEEEDPLAGLLVFGFAGFTLGVSFLDIIAASRFGLWMGMINKSPIQATVKTVAYALVLPFVLCVFSFCCGFLWPVIGLIKNILFINISQDRLKRNFRRIVIEQYRGGEMSAVPRESFTERRRKARRLPSVLPPEMKE